MAKGKIINTTPKHRMVMLVWSSTRRGTFRAGRNVAKRVIRDNPKAYGPRMNMLADRRLRQRTPGAL